MIGTEVLLVVGLMAFVGIVWGIERATGQAGHPVGLPKILFLALAAVPAVLWLAYFYLQDRKEPEPKHFVFGIYLLGGLAAWPVYQFLVGQFVPAAGGSLIVSEADKYLRAFLLIGLAQELAKYVVVRYSIYYSKEFDEPMDGIVYMTAVGIGFATAENYNYLSTLEGSVLLSVGAMHVVVRTLAHACFAGMLGYMLGRAKFVAKTPGARAANLTGGLVIAALLNGAFFTLNDKLMAGTDPKAWKGLLGAAGFAALVFSVLSVLMKREQDAAHQRS
jgi:RsiW-degrading membrane proteinase PrsW (M82 family)